MSENYSGDHVDLKNAAVKLLTGLRSFNLSAFGFGLGYAGKDDPEQRLLTPAAIDQLLGLIGVSRPEPFAYIVHVLTSTRGHPISQRG